MTEPPPLPDEPVVDGPFVPPDDGTGFTPPDLDPFVPPDEGEIPVFPPDSPFIPPDEPIIPELPQDLPDVPLPDIPTGDGPIDDPIDDGAGPLPPPAGGGRTPERSQELLDRARRMRSFYEPAWFGEQATEGQFGMDRYGPPPIQIGGFDTQYGKDLPPQEWQPGYGEAIHRTLQARRAYEQPGLNSVGRYGVGQLQNYGVGALDAYRPLAREENLRWR